MTNSENNKRIAANTAMLYVRMFLIMGVTLYTSRVVLRVLGVEDFGLYNVIGGVVILFSFINNAMVTATQRFLNYELGKNDLERARRFFSASMVVHALIALFILLAGESAGLYLLQKYINIPPGREAAANWVYQFTLLTACFNIMRAPYNAAIIAYEKMSFYAYISIIEVILRLGVAFMLTIFRCDHLIFYAVLVFVISILVTACYIIYCLNRFPVCRLSMVKDKRLYSNLAGFSGWSLFGSMANVGATQGISIILNRFDGVVVNAALGIALQVNAAIYSFVSNFQTAFRPQIVKSYAAGEKNYFVNMVMRTSKYSYLLLLVIALPMFLCCREILEIWLGTVPMYATEFCRLMILFSLLDALSGPLWMSVQAIGDIKNYQMVISSVILLNLPIGYAMLLFGFSPVAVIGLRVLLNAVTLMVRILYLKRKINFPAKKYICHTLAPSLLVTLLCIPIPYYLYQSARSFSGIVMTVSSSLLICALLIVALGLNREERKYIKNIILKRRV